MSRGGVSKPTKKWYLGVIPDSKRASEKPKFPGRSNEGNEIPWEEVSE